MQLLGTVGCTSHSENSHGDNFLLNFAKGSALNPMSSLAKLTQKGNVREYITSFENLINLVPDIKDAHQTSMFLSGLRADIQAGVRMHNPSDLSHAFDLALCQEEALTTTMGFSSSKPPLRQYNRPFTAPKTATNMTSLTIGSKTSFMG